MSSLSRDEYRETRDERFLRREQLIPTPEQRCAPTRSLPRVWPDSRGGVPTAESTDANLWFRAAAP